ncbi:peptidylprolyl isomerase [Pleionea sediminis]|uniref:peptidylprolyl isomerase n=1 Tax=Pleionea sediminis TaxID=2569479 RepID=UPI00197C0213|nr:peptidylprolyl isomerase [Pleionea sediminis]
MFRLGLLNFCCVLSGLFFSLTVASETLVKLQTNYGDIYLELYDEKSPITVKNFLRYVEGRHFDGTVFHRIAPDFVIQGGGFDKIYQAIDTFEPIKNEATNGLKNLEGTIAMARHNEKHSADSQFFINLKHNDHLDRRNETNRGYGYAVFGKVVRGLDVARKISNLPRGSIEHIGDEVPAYPVILQQAAVVEALPSGNKD